MLLLLVLLRSCFWLHLCCGLPPLPPTSSRDSNIPIFDPATTCEWQSCYFCRAIVAVVARDSFFIIGIIRCCWLPRCLHRFRRPLPFVGCPLLPSLCLLAVVFACVCLLLLAAACQRLIFTACGRRGSGAMACSGSGMGQGCLETSRRLGGGAGAGELGEAKSLL